MWQIKETKKCVVLRGLQDRFENPCIKVIVHPQIKCISFNYSPSCRSKLVWPLFIFRTQIAIFLIKSESFLPLHRHRTTTFKAQKGIKDTAIIVHVTSVVQQGSRLILPTGRSFATKFLSWLHEHIIWSQFYLFILCYNIWLINACWWTFIIVYSYMVTKVFNIQPVLFH